MENMDKGLNKMCADSLSQNTQKFLISMKKKTSWVYVVYAHSEFILAHWVCILSESFLQINFTFKTSSFFDSMATDFCTKVL